MSDDLDSLPVDKVSVLFAVEVAKWTGIEDCTCGDHKRGIPPQGRPPGRHVPDFAKSADAVLPFLQKCDGVDSRFCPQIYYRWEVIVFRAGVASRGAAPEFARAAATALIRAERYLILHGKQS